MRRALACLACLGAALLAGCAANPFASSEADAEAKRFSASEAQAVLYVYRDERFGGGEPMPLYLDGRFMGQTAGQTYFRWGVKPGEYVLSTRSIGGDGVELELEPGGIYFVWQEIHIGGDGELRADLHRVEAERGRRAVRQCELLADSR